MKERLLYCWYVIRFVLMLILSIIPILLLVVGWIIIGVTEASLGMIVYFFIWLFSGKWYDYPILNKWEKAFKVIIHLMNLVS